MNQQETSGHLDLGIGYYFKSLAEAENARELHEIETNTKFSVIAKDGTFNKDDFELTNHKILFEDIQRGECLKQLNFTGTPFAVIGKKRFDCTHGKDRAVTTKEKYKEKKIEKIKEDHCFIKSRFHAQSTKKMNCPAKITMRDVVFFRSYKAKANTQGCKRTITEKIKKDWNNNRSNIEYDRFILVQFPELDTHTGHLVNEISNAITNEAEESGIGWVQCNRCDRWYHCTCLEMTFKEARNLQSFYCR